MEATLIGPAERLGLWIVLSIIVLLLAVGTAFIALTYANRATPAKTLSAFCSGLTTPDYPGAYRQLSMYAQRNETETTFAATLDRAGGVKTCTFTGVNQNDSTATALVTLTMNVSFVPPLNYDSILINQKGTWKIDTLQTRR